MNATIASRDWPLHPVPGAVGVSAEGDTDRAEPVGFKRALNLPAAPAARPFAAAADVTVSTLHCWEKAGLLVSARRSEGGYRLYRPEQVPAARWIRKMQSLGFLRQQISDLQEIGASDDYEDVKRRRVEQLYQRHSTEVERKAQHYVAVAERLRTVTPGDLLREGPGAGP